MRDNKNRKFKVGDLVCYQRRHSDEPYPSPELLGIVTELEKADSKSGTGFIKAAEIKWLGEGAACIAPYWYDFDHRHIPYITIVARA